MLKAYKKRHRINLASGVIYHLHLIGDANIITLKNPSTTATIRLSTEPDLSTTIYEGIAHPDSFGVLVDPIGTFRVVYLLATDDINNIAVTEMYTDNAIQVLPSTFQPLESQNINIQSDGVGLLKAGETIKVEPKTAATKFLVEIDDTSGIPINIQELPAGTNLIGQVKIVDRNGTPLPVEHYGLVADTKPTSGNQLGDRFIEIDSKKVYIWNGTSWVEF